MASASSKNVVVAALAGNGLIALTKSAASIYTGSSYTGSSAMFSEAIRSLVDMGNQVLLLYGLKRAARKPDEKHPFGYSQEVYFWAFVVAILIFAVGAILAGAAVLLAYETKALLIGEAADPEVTATGIRAGWDARRRAAHERGPDRASRRPMCCST